MLNQNRWAKKTTNTPLFYICCYVALFIMRNNGYYYIKFQGDNYIARYIGGAWSLAGNINIYYDEDFEYIDDKNCFMFL